MKKRVWTVSAHKDQDYVELYELDLRARVATFLVDTVFDNFDHHITRHWLCGSGLPEWFWTHSVGTPQWDHEWGLLDNSIAAKMSDFSNRIYGWPWKHYQRCKVASVPITRDMLRELWPDCGFLSDNEEDEEEPEGDTEN